MSASVRRALVWSFGERYFSLAVTIASTMILARLLTPAQVGVFSLCAAVTSVAGILRDFGVSEYLIQEKELTRAKMRAAFGVALAVGWGAGAFVFFGRDTAAQYFNEPLVAQVLAVLTLNFLILPFASPAHALLSREMAFRKIFLIQTSCNTLQAACAVGLAYAGFGTMALAWAPIASVSLQTLLLLGLRPKDSLLLPSWRHTAQVWRYGSLMASSRVVDVLSRNAHEVIIAKLHGFASVGLFSRALGLLDMFNTNVIDAAQRVANPALARQRREGRIDPDDVARATAMLTAVSWPFFAFVAVFSLELVTLLFGSQWLAAAPICSVLAIAMMLNSWWAFGPNVLAVTGRAALRLRLSLVHAAAHVLLLLVLAPAGLHAVALAWCASSGLMVLIYMRAIAQAIGVPTSKLLGAARGSALVAALCLAVQALAAWAAHSLGLSALPTLLLGAAGTVVVWLVAIHRFGHPIAPEVAKLSGRLRPARRG